MRYTGSCMTCLKLYNKTRKRTVADRILVADTLLSRMVGLLGRKHLDPDEGLWIRPSSGVHTVGMSFAIDVVGLDKTYKVVKLWSHLVPHRITGINLKVQSVIELPAGSIEKHGLEVGDTLSLIAPGSLMASAVGKFGKIAVGR